MREGLYLGIGTMTVFTHLCRDEELGHRCRLQLSLWLYMGVYECYCFPTSLFVFFFFLGAPDIDLCHLVLAHHENLELDSGIQ